MTETIKFKKLQPDAITPTRGTIYSAGFDLYANEEKVVAFGCGNILVKTDIAVALPANCYGRIAMRSGLAYKEHLGVSAGVIDKDYRGNIGVLVFCSKLDHSYVIKKGERFAQLVIEFVSYADAEEVDVLPACDVVHEGYGSSGKF